MTEEKEVWKDIVGYEGLYQVSNKGRIKSLSRKVHHKNGFRLMKEIILSAGVGTTGYYLVVLAKELIPLSLKVHRLVAIAFIQNPNNKPQVNHINGNKLDNNVDNLEWATNKENVIHAWDTGLSKPTWLGVKGKDNPSSKPIIQLDMNGNFIKEFNSITEAKIATGNGHISCCVRGKRKMANGCKWEYKL